MSGIVLYDLPSKGHKTSCWSLNPWKTRMALNFKDLPYTTEWVEYPDIEPKFKSEFGLSANGTGTPYTIPTLRFSPSLVIMDSKKIAAELEKQHPQPSMHLDSPVIADVEEAIFKVMMPLIPVLRPQIPRNLLNPRSVEYFERTRAARFGMPLSELEKVKGGEPAWQAAEQPIKDMAALLKRQGGPYILGKTPSYADFMVVSMLEFVRRINEKDFDRMVGVDAAFKEQFKACEKWLAKDQ